jgi:hypothetical protein
MKTYGGVEVEVNGPLRAPAALPPGNELERRLNGPQGKKRKFLILPRLELDP